ACEEPASSLTRRTAKPRAARTPNPPKSGSAGIGAGIGLERIRQTQHLHQGAEFEGGDLGHQLAVKLEDVERQRSVALRAGSLTVAGHRRQSVHARGQATKVTVLFRTVAALHPALHRL